MIKICLAGPYPMGTGDKLRALLGEEFQVSEAVTQEQFDAISDADAVILRILKMPAPVFERFTNLKLVMRWGAGYDSVDIEEARRRGIDVCNTPGANAYAVAELAVGLMINLGRNMYRYYKNVCQNNWNRNVFSSNQSLNGKVVGLIGGGNIGRQVALRVGVFGASVQYYDPFRLPEETEQEFKMTYTDLETLLKTSDVISLHVPLTEGTRHMIGEKELTMMKPTAILINTARGGLIDDEALLRALESQSLAGAGLDCVEAEESEVTAKLCQDPSVIITPHIGGTTNDLATAIIPMLVENLVKLSKGQPLSYVVN